MSAGDVAPDATPPAVAGTPDAPRRAGRGAAPVPGPGYRCTPHDSTQRPHVALPLGGIGTGNVAICADGSLRQWQLHNIGNHAGALPGSFFAIRATSWEPPTDTVRVLQAPARESTGTPLVTDDEVADWQAELLARHPGVATVEFGGTYPFARLAYRDPDLPLSVSLEAFTPLVPGDVAASSIPAALFTFTLTNTQPYPVHGTLGAAVQNCVGWDGVSPIHGVDGAGYGGNTNRLFRDAEWTGVALENHTLAPDAPGAGQLVLAADDPAASALVQWRQPEEFLTFLGSRALADGTGRLANTGAANPDPQRHAPAAALGASPPGATWNAGLGVGFLLEPGERRTIRIALTWRFPNRYVNFEQFGPPRPQWGLSRFWLGNHYATVYPDAMAALDHVRRDWAGLRAASLSWPRTLDRSSLSDDAVTQFAAQLATVRSPTCFRGADGRFYGFEGVLGASTTMWSGAYGGSCPLNCNHVWNYAQALAAFFPGLERDMRRTEFEVMQAPAGYLPHRLIAPTYLRQLWDEPIGGPDTPALDGMLGAVLKTYREYRAFPAGAATSPGAASGSGAAAGSGAGLDWLRGYWPNLTRLLDHVERTWHTDGSGMLTGIQPSTHDIDLCGHNTFMGTLWLAALRAAETMAGLVGDDAAKRHYRALFETGSAAYDAALFNGEYYEQRLLPGDRPEFQWGSGCLSDQLIGQWWAHQLDLGHLLPAAHVRSALAAVVRHNLRHGFAGFDHPYRVFADGDDTGLLVCSWPRGGRPEVPTRYADEVWTGTEYQVAAHCLAEGLVEQGQAILAGLWGRYDGRRRNPYNEVECGDHYVRSLSGWSALQAMSGLRHDSLAGAWTFRIPDPAAPTLPFLTTDGYGLLSAGPDSSVSIECTGGTLHLRELRMTREAGPAGGAGATVGPAGARCLVAVDGVPVEAIGQGGPDEVRVAFPAAVRLAAGSTLTLTGVGQARG
ncbi:hypothetical protein Athai_26280 [Actinocatenispora thailandica]|uniref:Glycosyl-hydrolase family 116 catalytic region domain-containing protein n=1 Tax=Actinocatenispora thailandica TaxID=227318 RepID=A0A7R7DNR1_9ACTN|nr:GH116 family glycosyl-hydrolase [Actinocatenispora thailandica]BCJ35125.1 hypothetical protein Athai_26280 [Actinocatenispora thailandica]